MMETLFENLTSGSMVFLIRQTLIYAVPLMVVALAGVYAERSGVINLALEGIMIFGAFIGVLFVRLVQQWGWFDAAKAAGDWVSLQGFMLMTMAVAALLGAIFSLLLAFAAINLRADQTVGGTALNLLAPALVLFLIRLIANQNTLQMATGDSASWFMIKKSMFGYGRTDEVGFLFDTFVNKVYLATYVCILVFIIMSVILYCTRFGLRLRSCGENPQAADSLGINVFKMRYAGVTISGALAGMGGFVYALTTTNCTSNGDVAGFGFLALAVMIFGNWKPLSVAQGSGHQYQLLPPAALPDHVDRTGLYLQEQPRAQGRRHPLRQRQPVTRHQIAKNPLCARCALRVFFCSSKTTYPASHCPTPDGPPLDSAFPSIVQ